MEIHVGNDDVGELFEEVVIDRDDGFHFVDELLFRDRDGVDRAEDLM